MHPVSIRLRFPGIIALVIVVLFASTSTPAQEQEVEYVPTTLSDTLTMLKGQGGNIAISAGEEDNDNSGTQTARHYAGCWRGSRRIGAGCEC